MRTFTRVACGLVAGVTLTTTVVSTGTASAGQAQGSIVSAASAANTPAILDTSTATEKVLDIQQADGKIIVAGTFSQVQNNAPNGTAKYNRSNIFAFDAATGAVDTAFAPTVNGTVNTILPSADGQSVYLGGSFTIVNGQSSRNVIQLSLATGEKTAFTAPPFNGQVTDLAFGAGRLLVGGAFTTVNGVAHRGLAALNPVTGALDPYMNIQVSVNHNWPSGTAKGAVGVENFDVSPDGRHMVVIGNFKVADGLTRDQAMMVLLQPGSAVVDPNWRTRRFEPACYSARFDSYIRDVDFSPDGSYFAIVATGAYYPGTLCDSASRWETSSAGQSVEPTWVDMTGGDTFFSIEVTGSAVYAGGHQKWVNNPLGNSVAGPGAVPRPGLVAFDPRTGMPLTWNPGRNPRGDGAEALLATDKGLYVGMDTEYIGNFQYLRKRLAFFPLAGGTAMPAEQTGQLPANVFLAGREVASQGAGVSDVRSRFFDGTTVGPDQTLANSVVWARARGGFLVDGTLYYGYPTSGGTYYLYKRTFDGKTFGAASGLDAYNDPYWSTKTTSDRAGTTIYYRGRIPNFYGTQLSQVTGMFFQNGRLYYSRTGQSQLFYRAFSVDSGIVGATEFAAGGTGFNDVMGMTLSGNTIYAGRNSNGELRKIEFVNGAPSGAWSLAAPGPSAGGRDWRTRVMVLGPGGPVANQAPTAAFTSSCTGLTCSFDASGSRDPEGPIAGYEWDFGDGAPTASATGPTVSHTYADAGAHPVTLKVTDGAGSTGQTSQAVTVTSPTPGAGIAFRDGVASPGRTVSSLSLAVPASVQTGDALLMVLSTNSTVTGTAPAGWTLEDTITSGTSITTTVWSRVAQASDAGALVNVPLSGTAKARMQLLAYSGVSTTDPVAVLANKVDVGGTSHTTPTATAAAGSWVVSIWSDKQSDVRTWTPPAAGLTVRFNNTSGSSGDVATLLGDSGAAVPAGTVGGLTASVPTASNRATMFTIVLTPAG